MFVDWVDVFPTIQENRRWYVIENSGVWRGRNRQKPNIERPFFFNAFPNGPTKDHET